jgi:hypothetical protein
LIRSLRASAQRSTSVLFSFELSLLILAESFDSAIKNDSRRDGKVLVRADEKLTAFVELEAAIRRIREVLTSYRFMRTHLVFELPDSVHRVI